MSALLTARQICEDALREIGAYAINDTAADPAHIGVALRKLDMMVAELAGTERTFMFTPDTIKVALTGGVQTYDLLAAMGSSAPSEGLSFPVWATLDDGNGNRSPIAIVDRETLENKAEPAQSGTPDSIYIDRLNVPTLTVHPVPAAGADTYSIYLTIQRLGPDVADHRTGNVATGLRAAWQRWAILRLARDCGRGAVLRIPNSDRAILKDDETAAFLRLTAFENREHNTDGDIASFYDGV